VVKPATVIQWHRQGFRLYWRWRSKSGRPSINREARDLIRQMCKANPLVPQNLIRTNGDLRGGPDGSLGVGDGADHVRVFFASRPISFAP